MPSNQIVIQDVPPVYGMNTVDDPKRLRPGECVRLLNLFPGNPPTPRKGITRRTIPGTTGWTWAVPSVVFVLGGERYAVAIANDPAAGNRYYLVPENFDGTNHLAIGLAVFSTEPMFLIVAANGQAILGASETMDSWNGAALDLSYKVVESTTAIRALNIDTEAEATSAARVGDNPTGVFDIGDCFAYGFTLVRRNDTAAFEAGTTPTGMILPPDITGKPKEIEVFDPGVSESVPYATKDIGIEITTDGSSTKYYVTITHKTSIEAAAIAQGATHLRVYRSRKQATTALALAATKFYVKDIPLGVGVTTFDDKVSDAAQEGNLNQIITGYTSAPSASFGEYHKGRLWLYGDKVYYSEVPGGDGFSDLEFAAIKPQKWLGMFKPTQYYLDIDSANGEEPAGIARLNNDIYFFRERKLFALYGGDPLSSAEQLISDSIGCYFPYTITKVDIKGYLGNSVLFLSNEGPMVLQEGGRVRPLTEFKIKELYPQLSDELYGEYATDREWIIRHCTAAYFYNIWWIFYLTRAGINRMFGFYFDRELSTNQNAPRGAFEIEL